MNPLRAFLAGRLTEAPPDDVAFAGLAVEHGIGLLLRASRLELGPGATALLDAHHRTSLVTTTQALADMTVAGEAFDAAGLDWAVVKGPVLAEDVWAAPATRPYNDLDLLVRPRDLGTALDALRDAGFRLLDRNLQLAAEMGRGELSLVGPYGILVDLHWSLVTERSVRSQVSLPVDEMLDRRRPVDLGGFPGWALARGDALLHVAVHMALSGGHRLVWTEDVRASTGLRGYAWDELLALARRCGARLLLDVALHRAARTLGLDPRPSVRPWTLATAVYERRAPAGRPLLDRPTGTTPIASTRRTTLQSLRAARTARLMRGPSEADLHEPHDGPSELSALVAAAAEV